MPLGLAYVFMTSPTHRVGSFHARKLLPCADDGVLVGDELGSTDGPLDELGVTAACWQVAKVELVVSVSRRSWSFALSRNSSLSVFSDSDLFRGNPSQTRTRTRKIA